MFYAISHKHRSIERVEDQVYVIKIFFSVDNIMKKAKIRFIFPNAKFDFKRLMLFF